jgi:cell division protein FtsI/penicillin-binding protein 2
MWNIEKVPTFFEKYLKLTHYISTFTNHPNSNLILIAIQIFKNHKLKQNLALKQKKQPLKHPKRSKFVDREVCALTANRPQASAHSNPKSTRLTTKWKPVDFRVKIRRRPDQWQLVWIMSCARFVFFRGNVFLPFVGSFLCLFGGFYCLFFLLI